MHQMDFRSDAQIAVLISFKIIIFSYDSAIKQEQYWRPLRNNETNC